MSSARSKPGQRRVAQQGRTTGVLHVALADATRHGRALTTLAVHPATGPIVWISARGRRDDLLDDALLGQTIRVTWHRYEGGSRLYLVGPVIHAACPDRPNAPRRA